MVNTIVKKKINREKARYLRGDWVGSNTIKKRGNGPASKGYPPSLQPISFRNDMIKLIGTDGFYKLRVKEKRKTWAKVTKTSAEKAIKEQFEKLQVPPNKQIIRKSKPRYHIRGGNLSGNNLFVRYFAKTEEGKLSAKNKEGGLLKAASVAWKLLEDEERKKYYEEAKKINGDRIKKLFDEVDYKD